MVTRQTRWTLDCPLRRGATSRASPSGRLTAGMTLTCRPLFCVGEGVIWVVDELAEQAIRILKGTKTTDRIGSSALVGSPSFTQGGLIRALRPEGRTNLRSGHAAT